MAHGQTRFLSAAEYDGKVTHLVEQIKECGKTSSLTQVCDDIIKFVENNKTLKFTSFLANHPNEFHRFLMSLERELEVIKAGTVAHIRIAK